VAPHRRHFVARLEIVDIHIVANFGISLAGYKDFNMQLALLDLPWWGYMLVALGLTHVTIAAVTIFLHRHQAHRAMHLHPIASHFFRFWLWLTTGMVTKEWVAIHRKHHARSDTAEDPHSPQTYGIGQVLFSGSELYHAEAKNRDTLARYGYGTPDDWLERHIYGKYTEVGVGVMLIIDLTLFGAIGLTIWAVQMLWIPFFAAGVINGIGHYWGLPPLCDAGCLAQHRALGHPDWRGRAAQQPPCLHYVGTVIQPLVGV
jgi:fatty-acid desaturase